MAIPLPGPGIWPGQLCDFFPRLRGAKANESRVIV